MSKLLDKTSLDLNAHMFESAFRIDLFNEGTINKNTVTLENDNNTLKLYFSYRTIVAFSLNGTQFCVQNQWGPTTGKFLNDIEDDKKARIPYALFEKKLSAAFHMFGKCAACPKEKFSALLHSIKQ